MAKGNLFLGLARGSVGDVTMYRRDGNQVARARVRKIANPKSSGQIYTRAILATVAKAYSAGKAVFDHAFEDYKVPEGAQRRFLKLNLDALRSRVYDDVEQQTDVPYSTPLVGPNSPSPVAGEFIVSEGSLRQNLIKITPASADSSALITFGQPNVDETLGDFFGRLGITEGDIFSIIMFAFGDTMAGLTPKTEFAWVQFQLGDYDPTAIAGSSYINNVFRVAHSANITAGKLVYTTDELQFGDEFELNDKGVVFVDGIGLDSPSLVGFNGTFAIIRSRENSPLRSSAQMQWFIGDDRGGLAWSQVVAAWAGGYQLGESDLLLEGSEFPRQRAVPFMTANFVQPTSISALNSEGSPALTFRSAISPAEFNSRLSVSGAGMLLIPNPSDGTLILGDGTDSFAVLTLAEDGMSVSIRVTGMNGPSGFSFVWQ